MTLVCAWCDSFLGESAPLDRPGVTHGMCPECRDERLHALRVEVHAPVEFALIPAAA